MIDEWAQFTREQFNCIVDRLENRKGKIMEQRWKIIFTDESSENFSSFGFDSFMEKLQKIYAQKFHEIHVIIRLN